MICGRTSFYATFLILLFLPLQVRTLTRINQQSDVEAWNKPFQPFRVIGNIYYVGTNNLACYLITTRAGNILIDTALAESAPIIRSNIETLGVQLQDIKIMLSGHSHFDHVAGHAAMKAKTGAKVYATKADAEILESGGKKGFHPLTPYAPVKVDKIIKDGETVHLGEVTLTAHLTPGHTEGNTTWTMKVEDNGKQYDVVFVGSMSINPGVHMVNFPAWPEIAEVYAKSFQTLKTLPCDVFLGPHAPFFDMENKVLRMKAEKQRSMADNNVNYFIDPEGYRNYIVSFEKSYNEQLQRERQGK
jgi:metallo-beta-lactamase class B